MARSSLRLPALPRALAGPAAKRAVKDTYGAGLTAASRLRHQRLSAQDALVILGTGRSGTTLLLQLLAALPGTLPVYEPLRSGEDPALRGLVPANGGFVTGPPSAADEAIIARWWTDVLSGRRLTWWSASQASARQWWDADRVVAKEIRANRAAAWLLATFPGIRVVGIVRHPCAVISSMLAAPGIWNDWSYGDIVDPLRSRWPDLDLDDVLAGTGRHGWLAAFWAADTLALREAAASSRLLLLTYEALVTTPAEHVDAIFAHVGHAVPTGAVELLGQPSATANEGAPIRQGGGLLTGWTSRMAAPDVAEILRVTDALDVAHYDRGPEPVSPLSPLFPPGAC